MRERGFSITTYKKLHKPSHTHIYSVSSIAKQNKKEIHIVDNATFDVIVNILIMKHFYIK